MKKNYFNIRIIIALILTVPMVNFSTLAQKMDINQTLSDGAQKFTIAFSGLAFLSGEEESYTFLPPGKLSDYFGFQYLRDNDIDQLGHNTDFVTKSANNLLILLNENQKEEIISLAKLQVKLINDYGYYRFPLIRSFKRLLDKDFPIGSDGLDSISVMNYSADLFKIDGIISYQRAKLFGKIIRSLSQYQRDSLDKLTSVGMKSWLDLPDQIDKKTLTHDEHVAVMTYASEMFGWYAGDTEADVYFCPERQATYFGGFYMKDIPAMGNPNYTIDANITANKGRDFLDQLNNTQRKLVEDIIINQKPTLLKIIATREAISNELRKFWLNESIDSLEVIRLSEEYGKLDGLLAYWYATAFARIGWTLTNTQKDSLISIRDLDDYPASKPFLFSEKIEWPSIINTDFLFNKKTTSVENNGTNALVYPNPFVDNISIETNNNTADSKISIINLMGETVYETTVSDNKNINIDLHSLSSGVYFLQIYENNQYRTIKIDKVK